MASIFPADPDFGNLDLYDFSRFDHQLLVLLFVSLSLCLLVSFEWQHRFERDPRRRRFLDERHLQGYAGRFRFLTIAQGIFVPRRDLDEVIARLQREFFCKRQWLSRVNGVRIALPSNDLIVVLLREIEADRFTQESRTDDGIQVEDWVPDDQRLRGFRLHLRRRRLIAESDFVHHLLPSP